jgi:hypothetical protein
MYDIVKNPIPSSNLFKTISLGEIQEMIEQMPTSQRANASLVLMMTLNACAKIVEDEILSKEVFAS